MLTHSFLALVALAASSLFWVPETNACQNHGGNPTYWLAELRNSTGTTSPFITAPGVRKIRFTDGAAPVLISASEKDALERSGMRFFDVTDHDLDDVRAQRAADGSLNLLATFPSGPKHQAEVNPILASLSVANLKSDLDILTAYNNRYYRSPTGAASANDLAVKLQTIAAAAPGSGGGISVKTFNNTFAMSSVVARIEGTNPTAPIVIIGAHLDTINQGSPMTGRAPGADDDGTGSVNLIEAFRKMTSAGFKPANPVEYHWYAGEEGGLLGSAAIAEAYAKAGTAVRGMLQLDMTGYVKPGTGPVVGFITDYVDLGLTAFTKTLVTTYLTNVGIAESKCGYACSDHASWTASGYSSVLPFESTFGNDNPNIHGVKDLASVSGFDWDHSLQFTKLAVAFLMELSLPDSTTPTTSSSTVIASSSTVVPSSTQSSSTVTTTTTRPTSTSSSRRTSTTTTTSNCPRWWPNCPWA